MQTRGRRGGTSGIEGVGERVTLWGGQTQIVQRVRARGRGGGTSWRQWGGVTQRSAGIKIC